MQKIDGKKDEKIFYKKFVNFVTKCDLIRIP